MEERVPDEEWWRAEAAACISDISKHVKTASLGKEGVVTAGALINLTTLEGADYCVEVSGAGFRVVGRAPDDISLAAGGSKVFETPYALLNSISRKYRESFGGELMAKLTDLANTQN